VNSTKIFARSAATGRQYIVYSMALEAKQDLAMVLPLPVRRGSGEAEVQFINLKEYSDFFDDLLTGFPPQHTASFGKRYITNSAAAAMLTVQAVGDFEASFVPTLKDFSR